MEKEKGFLEIIADRYSTEYGSSIRNIVFVFPNRRSSVYFRDHLTSLSSTPLLSPPIYSINDLISECSGLNIPETYELIFELYNTYRAQIPEKQISMENFFQTGKIILSDLNEIDKNLADTKNLFRSLKELKGLEDPGNGNPPKIQKEYLELWLDLETIYDPFRKSLESHMSAYEGMAFRKVAEDIGVITKKGWEKIVFAGFNALSGSEREILIQLQKKNRVDILTESDRYFNNDHDQEAGVFLRKYSSILGSNQLIPPPGAGLTGEKNINVVETTSDVGQVKYCGIRLSELLNKGENPEEIGIILPDENLLFPILNSLPENTGKGNISIGYPLRQTSVYTLYDSLMAIHTGQQDLISRKDLLRVIEHPYIKLIADTPLTDLYEKIKNGTDTFISRPEKPAGILELIISPSSNSTEFLEKLLAIFDKIRISFSEGKIHISGIEKEFIHRFYTLATKLNEIIIRTGEPVSIKGFHRMFSDLITSVHIPFTGEPLEGFQILGVLEMQNLRFKNLFILSMNEDQFPKGKHTPTYIPQDVRRTFGLPEFGEREAVYAYHFYRMIANSCNITLLYSGVKPGSMAGERSRFIDQILLEYGEYNPKANINQITADFILDIKNPPRISIEKSKESLDRIGDMSYSPTSLRAWMECPLRFWFQYILKLKEESDTDDAHNPAKFGSISHKALEKVYQSAGNKEIGKHFYSKFSIEVVEKIILESFKIEKVNETETGLNKITFEVIKKLFEKFLKDEEESVPFRIQSLEENIKDADFSFFDGEKNIPVKLKGIIDRIDTKDGITRVIDYKTGNVEKLKISGELKDIDFVKHKEIFQLLFYSLLLKNKNIHRTKFKIGIYPFKNLSDTLGFVSVNGNEVLDHSIFDEFEPVLSAVLSEIFDPKIPFTQTDDEKHCKYCLHKNICERSLSNKLY